MKNQMAPSAIGLYAALLLAPSCGGGATGLVVPEEFCLSEPELCAQLKDTDGDGVPNARDNCDGVANPGQEDGDNDKVGTACDLDENRPQIPAPDTDFDNDGVPDGKDDCPAVADPGQEDGDSDGVGTACDLDENVSPSGDLDGDGVPDGQDHCPAHWNPNQEDWDSDGLPDACDDDDDNDGWLDPVDNCQFAADPTQQDSDFDGNGDLCDLVQNEACPDFVPTAECKDGWVICEGNEVADLKRSVVIKGTLPALYWYAVDGKRYVIPNEKTFRTWFPVGEDCPSVRQISDADLASVAIGGNVTYRPGVRLIKIMSDPKVYAVSKGGVLRWVTTEPLLAAIYGPTWQTYVDDLSDAFFVSYFSGLDIVSASDYDRLAAMASAPTIDHDKGLLP